MTMMIYNKPRARTTTNTNSNTNWNTNGGSVARVTLLSCALLFFASISLLCDSTAASAPPTGTFDFTQFEALVPSWVDQFRVNDTLGAFSFLPNGGNVTVYGACDIVFLYAITGLLDQVSPEEKQTWANIINSFQNETGWFTPQPFEYSVGYVPWHTSAYAVSALRLLGHYPVHNVSWAYDIAQNQTLWREVMEPLLNSTLGGGIWYTSHKIASIPAVLLMMSTDLPPPNMTSSSLPTPNPSPQVSEFLDWYFDWLAANVDPLNGYWCKNASWLPPSNECMAGAFHMFFTYAFDRREWNNLESVVNTSLSLQHNNGLWGANLTYGVDMDGLYECTRSSNFSEGYRWSDVQTACFNYLTTSVQQLNDKQILFGSYVDTHWIVGATAAVAECRKWFPDFVVTNLPWIPTIDRACYI